MPNSYESGQTVVAADYDSDGDMDLFVGGRVIPGQYPLSPKSYLLQNENGRFVDVTSKIAPQLLTSGMVSGVSFSDYDLDGD